MQLHTESLPIEYLQDPGTLFTKLPQPKSRAEQNYFTQNLLRYGEARWQAQEKVRRLSDKHIRTNLYDLWQCPLLITAQSPKLP